MTMTGGCICGAVRYETTGKTFGVQHCHCHSCRIDNGGPVVTLAGYNADQVTFSGDAHKIYASSPGVGRAFCGTCDTPLTWEGDGGELGPIVEFYISTFDNPDVLLPTGHSFDPERFPGSTSQTACPAMKVSPNAVQCCATAWRKRAYRLRSALRLGGS
ncbi:MAG: GFA family protein [Pseudomonadota bacterium]